MNFIFKCEPSTKIHQIFTKFKTRLLLRREKKQREKRRERGRDREREEKRKKEGRGKKISLLASGHGFILMVLSVVWKTIMMGFLMAHTKNMIL